MDCAVCRSLARVYRHRRYILIAHGADTNKPTADGSSPLFIATANGHTAIVSMLIKAGAKTDALWMGVLTVGDAAEVLERTSALRTLRAYESEFGGNILGEGAEYLAPRS
jgi:ankyrin repeat protein